METIKNILVIVGIFVLLWIGVMLFIKSEEVAKKAKKQNHQIQAKIQTTNQQLDDLLQNLQVINQPLEKGVSYIRKLNQKVFK